MTSHIDSSFVVFNVSDILRISNSPISAFVVCSVNLLLQ